MEREFRRCRSNLSIIGNGITAFTAWELKKPILAVLRFLDGHLLP